MSEARKISWQHGWATVAIADGEIEDARSRVADQHTDGARFGKTSPEQAFIGFLGEDVVAWVCEASGIPVVRLGGVDDKPDLLIRGKGYEVKTRPLSRPPVKPEYQVRYLAHGLHKPSPAALAFCVWVEPLKAITFVGVNSAATFFGRARFYRAGEEMEPGFEAREDYFVRLISDLYPPDRFISGLKGNPHG